MSTAKHEQRWHEAKQIFSEALEQPAEQRDAFLRGRCGDDADLVAEVLSLLAAHHSNDGLTTTFTVSPLSEKAGTIVGRYKLLQKIGEGGFGAVFMAEQREPVVRKVAIKIIKVGMDTRQVIARFEAERQALALMDHPNIARVLDAGASDSGRPYFVMEYVAGDPITAFADAHKLNIRARLELFASVCSAVQHAHSKGVIHRDIKPHNVLVSMVDGRAHAKVIDFGIAKATGGRLTEKTLFTEHRQLIGTPEYMSPEQAEGSPDLDTRTDVYALGVLLYELLAGVTPFDASRLRAAAYAEMQRIIREEEPPAPSMKISRSLDKLASTAAARKVEPGRLSALVRGELDWIVLKALDKDRARRYETPSQFAADVQRFLAGEAVLAGPVSAVYRLGKLLKRNKAAAVAGAMVCVVMMLATGVSWWFAFEAAQQRDRALASEAETRRQSQIAVASAMAEAAAQQRLADAEAFMRCGSFNAKTRSVTLQETPSAGAVRHMAGVHAESLWIDIDSDAHVDLDETFRLIAARDSGLKALITLDLVGAPVTDARLKELARADTGLKALTTLNLWCTQVTDAGLKELARADTGLKALTTLILKEKVLTDGVPFLHDGSLQVTDAGVRELARADTGLKQLTTLDLLGTQVTDEGLKALARADTGLKSLTALNLGYTNVTDAGVRELARAETGLKALTTLDLGGTQVTDAGLKELARADTGLKALTTLSLYSTQVTDAGTEEIRRRFPNIHIDR
ncbi:MAG: protein kinase [Phycisphaerales bacterium]|nr:protein kinase [Phycisphaerales bacterium]